MEAEFLQIDGTAEDVGWITTIAAPQLNVRQEPSPVASILAQLTQDQTVEIFDLSGEKHLWLRIRFHGQAGFIATKHTRSVSDRLTSTEISVERQRITAGPVSEHGDLFEELQHTVIYQSQRDNEARDATGNTIETPAGQMCNLRWAWGWPT